MCWSKLFGKPEVPVVIAKRRLLTFGKNLYGGGNDLNGCVNDSHNLSNKLLELFPDIDIKKYLDYEVTISRYKEEVLKAISELHPGATVVILADSCYSGTVTRQMGLLDEHPSKPRFLNPGFKRTRNVKSIVFLGKGDIRWIVISGCSEHETSMDAYIGSSYVGAFTYYAIKALKLGITYREWFSTIRMYLPSNYFDQSPTLEGPEELLNRKIGEGETLFIHNSSHGSYTRDQNGDEADGVDESLYFDGHLTDDIIGTILSRIP